MSDGIFGIVLSVDLSQGQIVRETLPDKVYRDFLGGYGLGVRMLYDRIPPGADPFGADNVLGFLPGLLTGTGVPFSGRFMVVGKSPLTGGWGEANCGGHFGPVLRSTGLDGVFVKGIASNPVYLLIDGERAELHDASHLWGLDSVETVQRLQDTIGEDCRVVTIGPAGENKVLFSAIMADGSRAAARSGLGAVMGAKRLKAIVVRGDERVPLYDKAALRGVTRQYATIFKANTSPLPGFVFRLTKTFMPLLRLLRFKPSGGPISAIVYVYREYGTCSGVTLATETGDAPVRNWLGVGGRDFPMERSGRISDDSVIQHQVRKYFCRNCPVGCGGFVKLEPKRFPVEEGRKPEFETLVAFGTLLLNDDLESIVHVNNLCDRYGIDTISAGACVAFALECAEKGILSSDKADGLELEWGNAETVVALVEKIARREGIGDLLADGVKRAAEKLGRGADSLAMHVGGQELPMHDPRYEPVVGVSYQVDPTPARHVTCLSGLYENDLMQEIITLEGISPPERFEAQGKGRLLASINRVIHMVSCSGLCIYSLLMGRPPVLEWINAATGWNLSMEELVRVAQRIQLMRHVFNVRHGVHPQDFTLPERAAGRPPLSEGPLRGVTLDVETMAQEYFNVIGWDFVTDAPSEQALSSLGLEDIARDLAQRGT